MPVLWLMPVSPSTRVTIPASPCAGGSGGRYTMSCEHGTSTHAVRRTMITYATWRAPARFKDSGKCCGEVLCRAVEKAELCSARRNWNGGGREPRREPHETSTASASLSSPSFLSPFFLFFFFFLSSVEIASSSTSAGSSTLCSLLTSGGGPPVMRTVLSDGIIIAVNLYCATNSSFCSYSTGYSMKRLCLTHSMMPMRHSRSLPARSVKGMVGKRSLT